MARRTLGPAALAVVQAVTATLDAGVPPAQSYHRDAPGAHGQTSVLVACSGGADSLALAAGTADVARRRDLRLAAVVVDHRLQEGSARIAARAVEQLNGLGYADAVVRGVDVVAHGEGIEAAARSARYAALAAEASQRDETENATIVLLGHTLDDQAETVLLGLVRGSGTRSLAGMSARTGRFRRPLLGLPRAGTLQACHEWGLEPWQDPHNDDARYTRVRVRRDVLPGLERDLGPGIVHALARTAAQARDDADLLDALTVEAHPDADELDCTVLVALPPALRTRVVRRWLLAQGSDEATYGHVRAVERLVTDWRGQKSVAVPGGSVTRAEGRLRRHPHLRA